MDQYLSYFGLDGSQTCTVLGNTDKDRGTVLFGPAPLARAFAVLVDLQEVPRKSLLEKLLAYAKDEGQESVLRGWLDKQTYLDKVEKRFMTVLEILQSLPRPLVVPCEELLQILPPLLPRYYSISSSLRFLQPVLAASITCARVDYVSPTGRPHPGVASHWLYSLRDRPPGEAKVFFCFSFFFF